MESFINAQLFFPVVLLIIQTYILLFGTLYLMKRMTVISTEIIDMEIGQTVVAGSFLFGIFFISTANYAPLLQSFRLLASSRDGLFSVTFYRFGQYFLNVFAAEIVFILLSWLNIRLFLGGKKAYGELKEGHIALSLLAAVVILSFSILTKHLLGEVIDYLTPKPILFN